MTEESGSTFKVPVTKILKIKAHENADKLEIATVFGFDVIVSKGTYKEGDKVLYIPVDSILPHPVEVKLLGNSKIKLNKGRVRACKIRGVVSNGMLSNPELLGLTNVKVEEDCAEKLGIKKYDPNPQRPNRNKPGGRVFKSKDHPLFHSYNGINNIKWYPELFKVDEIVVVEEKTHGTNSRYSILPYTTETLWRKFKKLIGLTPEFEKNYGSNNVQISRKFSYTGFYGTDVYGEVGNRLKIFDKIKPNEIVYGEIIGPGIQKNYHYGHTEHHFVLFDVKVYDEKTKTMTWLNAEEVTVYAKERGFTRTPILYIGPFDIELIEKLSSGPSTYDPTEKVKEGIVIKSLYEYNYEHMKSGRKSVKWINNDYLLDHSNSDEH